MDTTVGALKAENVLEVQYSAELAEEDITAINAQMVEAGDWALISLLAFDTEESLTVTMKDGRQIVIRVTDAQEIANAEANTINVNKSYLICYQDGNDYYMLKNDGSVEKIISRVKR